MGSVSPPVLYEDDQYLIRPAKSTAEFKGLWWSFMQKLGWNRGYHDLETYMNPSLGSGMLILIDRSEGKPVGHVAAVVNSNSTAWMSMFVIDAAHRGKGMGRELFKAAVADAKKAGVEILGLDGVREQKGTYERRGFVESPLGVVKIMMRPLVSKQPFDEMTDTTQPADILIVDVRSVPLDLLASHELKRTGFERPRLWSQEYMFHRPDVSGFALVSRSPPTQVDDIKAWALTRRCSSGVRIGPVYAQDATSARLVLAATMKNVKPNIIRDVSMPNEPIGDLSEEEIVDKATLVTEVWCGNPDAEKVFEELGWKGVGVEYHRMWVDSKATEQWTEGGLAQKGVFAVFDAAIG